MSQQPEEETKALIPAWIENLPVGIRPNSGVGMAHDTTPVWSIVGNTIRVGNIMLVRLDPDLTTQSDFQAIAHAVGAVQTKGTT